VIEVPSNDPDATASPLDQIALTVAHAGSDRDLVTQTFARGTTIEMSGVPFGDDLVIHMSGFVGASNVAYGRSCAIAVSSNVAPPAPHIFFSRSVKFANLSVSPETRLGGTGIAFQGEALLIGGSDATQAPVVDVERYDPSTGQLTRLGKVLARSSGAQALIGTVPPRVVVVGGKSDGDNAKFVEVLDDSSIDRIEFADLARVDLTATTLVDGRVMVIGGTPPGKLPSADIDEIAPADTSISVRKLTTPLLHARSGHTATRLGDDLGAPVLITGGVDGAGAPIDVAELFKPLTEEIASPATFAPKLNVPRSGHLATLLPDGSVLIIGGLDALKQPVRKIERFSLDTGFVAIGDLPADAGVVDFATARLPDGRILITGGRTMTGAQPLNTAYIIRLDPNNGLVDVIATDHLGLARAGHQMAVLCDGTVLVSGGTQVPLPAERYNPPAAGRR
jgi:galactose oxidase-like protein